MNECTCAHPHATVGTVKWQRTQQHSAHCDKRYVRLYCIFACASVHVCRGLLCVCAVCSVNVWSVAQSSVWLRPVERALCSLCIYSVMCAFVYRLAFWLFGFCESADA